MQHEFAHAIGFVSHDFQGPTGQEGVSVQCVFSIQTQGEFRDVVWPSFCQHEIEYVYAAYGQRPGGINTSAFWDHPIVTGLITSPFTINIDQGATDTIDANKLFFGNSVETQPADLGGTTLSWSVDPFQIATVDPTGETVEVRGGDTPGNGHILVALGNVPSTYLQSTALMVDKHRIALTVKDTTSVPPGCTPGGALRVTSITVDQEPAITTPGSHVFTAATAGCQGSVFYDWTFDPSLPGWCSGSANIGLFTSLRK